MRNQQGAKIKRLLPELHNLVPWLSHLHLQGEVIETSSGTERAEEQEENKEEREQDNEEEARQEEEDRRPILLPSEERALSQERHISAIRQQLAQMQRVLLEMKNSVPDVHGVLQDEPLAAWTQLLAEMEKAYWVMHGLVPRICDRAGERGRGQRGNGTGGVFCANHMSGQSTLNLNSRHPALWLVLLVLLETQTGSSLFDVGRERRTFLL